MAASTSNAETIELTDECTIYDVAELKEQIQDIIERGVSICFDLSKINILDAAVVQLLLSTKIELAERKLSFNISALSEAALAFINNIYCQDLLAKNDLAECKGEQHG